MKPFFFLGLAAFFNLAVPHVLWAATPNERIEPPTKASLPAAGLGRPPPPAHPPNRASGTATLPQLADGLPRPQQSEWSLVQAARINDLPRVRSLLKSLPNLGVADRDGNTALHWACLNQNEPLVQLLLSHGAPVDAVNQGEATPLSYGAGHKGIAERLLQKSANVNHTTRFHSSPLHVAARHPRSHAIIRLFLNHGVAPQKKDGGGHNAINIAAQSGDLASVNLLLDHGVTPSDLVAPARFGHRLIVERFLEHGVKARQETGFTGSPLNAALYGQNLEIAIQLIEAGADLTRRSPIGQHETPPLLWPVYNQQDDPRVLKAMFARKADPNIQSALGERALDWAEALGHKTLVQTLQSNGGRPGTRLRKRKSIPSNPLPGDFESVRRAARPAAERALKRLQDSSDQFLQSPLVARQRCVSCHQQTLPAVAFGWARARGLELNEISLARQIQDQIRYWKKGDKVAKSFELIRPQPDAPVLLGYGLMGLAALGHRGDGLTEAMVRYLLVTQKPDGSWPAADYRPPMEDGPIQGAALAIGALKRFPVPGRELEMEECIARARQFLLDASPISFNQRVFQVLGLQWAMSGPSIPHSLIESILTLQKTDGGWSQLPGLESDAWATGQALVALHQADHNAQALDAFQSGIRFLLRTQFADGSWYVRSRSWPFQPHFETGFPHGKDQWISAGGTAWATMALLLTQPETSRATETDWLRINVASKSTNRAPNRPELEDPIYQETIHPILKRSCGGCHGADAQRKKGQFDIQSAHRVKQGGQSGKPAIIPGDAAGSQLIQMVTNQLEDMEMPPTGRRDQFPPLATHEVAALSRWINQLPSAN